MAGYYARQATPPAIVVPLVKETTGPRLAYRIAMGVRYADQEWKRELNRTIRENQPAINKLLLSFGVPLLDDDDRAITEDLILKIELGPGGNPSVDGRSGPHGGNGNLRHLDLIARPIGKPGIGGERHASPAQFNGDGHAERPTSHVPLPGSPRRARNPREGS